MAESRFYGGSLALPDVSLWRNQVSVTSNTKSLVASETGTLFILDTAGAATVNLPALKKGLVYGILNKANQNLTIVRSGSNTILAPNNAAATSLIFNTSNQKIGSFVKIYADAVAAQWLVEQLSSNTMTVA
jgi:hypothetical protein